MLTFYHGDPSGNLYSLLMLIVLPIVVLSTIKNLSINSRENNNIFDRSLNKIKSWKRSEVIKDVKFYIISLNMLAMPWIATGVFVYQSFISDSKS